MTSSPVRVGVVGCGAWGRNIVRVLRQHGALAAVVDTDPLVVHRVALDADVPAMEFPALLADRSIGAVAIASPSPSHFAVAEAALLADKHVFVEKPLAISVRDAEKLCLMADQRGLTLMVGHLLRYHPAFRKLQQLVTEGQVGAVHYIYSNRLNFGRIRREESTLWSFAPHDVSAILALMGELPDEVSASGAAYLGNRVADVTHTRMRFRSGTEAYIFVSWLHPFKEQRLVVIGADGMLSFNDAVPWAGKLQFFGHRVGWREGTFLADRGEAVAIQVEAEEPLVAELRHFLDCVQHRHPPLTDGAEGVAVLRILEAAENSMNNGSKPVAVGRLRRPGVVIHESAYIDEPCDIGEGTRIWHFSHILRGARIGRNCIIGQNVMIGPDVVVGDNCKIQNNVSIYRGVLLEDGVFCGPSAVFTNVATPRAEVERKDEFRPTLVKRGATIGANATIVCGHTLGEWCMIGAGAVVTRDVPPHALMAGAPARRIGWVSHAGEVLGPDLVCARTGRRYRHAGPDRLEEATEAT